VTEIKISTTSLGGTTVLDLEQDKIQHFFWGGGGKDLFGLYFHIIVHHWKKSKQEIKQDRKLEAETDADTMKEGYLLTYLSWIIHTDVFFFLFWIIYVSTFQML